MFVNERSQAFPVKFLLKKGIQVNDDNICSYLIFSSSSNSHPPPLPARPATASGALGKMGGSTHSISKVDGSSPTLPGSADSSNRAFHNTSYHHQQQQFSRQRIQGLNASSNSNISREHQ